MAFTSRETGDILSPDECSPEQIAQWCGLGQGDSLSLDSPQTPRTKFEVLQLRVSAFGIGKSASGSEFVALQQAFCNYYMHVAEQGGDPEYQEYSSECKRFSLRFLISL
jgi:hypothetical protein